MKDPAEMILRQINKSLRRERPQQVEPQESAYLPPPIGTVERVSNQPRKVLTYYETLPGKSLVDDYKLMLLWQENWSHFGFEPIVLSEFHAKKHLWFDEMELKAKSLPTVNTPEYERACYIRHLAFAEAGGGLCVDYDVFCYKAFPIQPIPDVLQCFQRYIPSVLFGSPIAYNKFARKILDYQVGRIDTEEFLRPHVSDMHILKNTDGDWKNDSVSLVKNFGDLGWEESPFVHFSSGSMGTAKKLPKWKFIKELRPWK